MQIKSAESDADIERCFPVMHQLRSHLVAEEFVDRIRRQQQAGYRLVYVESDGVVKAVAGYRLSESLSWGKFMYIDDIVTTSDDRSQGYGSQLFDWLVELARREGCARVDLDSGVHRILAHRFYTMKGMGITGHHLSLRLDDSGAATL